MLNEYQCSKCNSGNIKQKDLGVEIAKYSILVLLFLFLIIYFAGVNKVISSLALFLLLVDAIIVSCSIFCFGKTYYKCLTCGNDKVELIKNDEHDILILEGEIINEVKINEIV